MLQMFSSVLIRPAARRSRRQI